MTYANFVEMDKKTRSSIILNLYDEILWEIAAKTSTKAIWDKIKVLYTKKIVENQVYLRQSLYIF